MMIYENPILAESLEQIWRIAENNVSIHGDNQLALHLKDLFVEHLDKLSEEDQNELRESMESWGA